MTYRDDIGRERCSRCAKLTFRDEWSAGEAARIAVSRGTALRSYFERGCGYWHLTSQQQRAAAGWRLPPSRMPTAMRAPRSVSAPVLAEAGAGPAQGRNADKSVAMACLFIVLFVPLLPGILTFWILNKLKSPRLLTIVLAVIAEVVVVDLTCLAFLDVAPFRYVSSGIVSVVMLVFDQIYIHIRYLLFGDLPGNS